MDRNEAFGQRLRRAIDESEMDQKTLAQTLKVREATVTAWVQGTPPSGVYMLRLPEILRVSGHWLLTGGGPKDVPDESDALRLEIIGRITDKGVRMDERKAQKIRAVLNPSSDVAKIADGIAEVVRARRDPPPDGQRNASE